MNDDRRNPLSQRTMPPVPRSQSPRRHIGLKGNPLLSAAVGVALVAGILGMVSGFLELLGQHVPGWVSTGAQLFGPFFGFVLGYVMCLVLRGEWGHRSGRSEGTTRSRPKLPRHGED